MTDISSTPFVVAFCLLATLASFALVRRLIQRRAPTLRDKVITFIIGLVGVELTTLPAILAALVGDDLLGLRNSGFDHWIVIGVYAALTLYVIVRLFPWYEVEAMAADPNIKLRDIMARIMAKSHEMVTPSDEQEPR